MAIRPTLEDLISMPSSFKIVPVVDSIPIGNETPLTAFEKLAANKAGAFLLESAAQGVWSRYSFIGVNSRGELIKQAKGKTRWTSRLGFDAFPNSSHEPLADNALDALEQMIEAWKTPHIEGLPPLVSGLVGVMAWDLIREIENLSAGPIADYVAPVISLSMFSDLVVFDHQQNEILVVANIFRTENCDLAVEYENAGSRIASMISGLQRPKSLPQHIQQTPEVVKPNHITSKADFFASLERAKHYVQIGDVFQVVLSQRFDIEVNASPLDVYRKLRELNPSPYMYLFNFQDEAGDFAVVGSSPEALVTVTEGNAVMHPIAGSRPRGKSEDEDFDLAESLIADEKERAEHLMLVDLVRNDLLKVCESSSVNVTEFMQIHKFSHIMHLVSTVEGELRDGENAVDVFRATFPAGTLSGAPKPRALEIIDELEPTNRGIYGGVVGYFDFAGNADLAIAIRTAFIRNGIARVQAGAGIVLDSNFESEYQETINKAGAPLNAIQRAYEI